MRLLFRIVKTWGNKGEVVCASPVSFLDTMECGQVLHLKRRASCRDVEVESIRTVCGQSLIKFKNIESISEAYNLLGFDVWATEGELQSEQELEIDLADWAGYRIVNGLGEEIGMIKETIERTLQPLLCVQDGAHEYLIPLVSQWVVHIDHSTKQITMDLPDGLLDINLP